MGSRIYVAGHRGMVGTALCQELSRGGDVELVTANHHELDLRDQAAVREFFARNAIDEVYLAAAKVGGIHANNTYPADFICDNLVIQTNVIEAAFRNGVERLLFLGSSCIYPKLAPQPMHEGALMSGPLEPTNEPYAVAKIAGIKLCESYNRQHGVAYRSVMPTNLYGPNDNFHPENSHVIPAMMRRFHEAKQARSPEVVVWGSGEPLREFLHVSDMARASVFVMNLSASRYEQHTLPMESHINVGTGVDCSIRELARVMARVVGFEGELVFDTSRPDGTPRKLLNVDRLKQLGWEAGITLEEGLADTYRWFLENQASLRE